MFRAIQIIRHTLNQIINNLGIAIRITLAWAILISALYFIMIYAVPDGTNLYKGVFSAEGLLLFVAILFITIFGFVSCAISWHRFMLLDEAPRGIISLPPINLISSYFLKWFALTLLILVIVLAALVLQSLMTPVLYSLTGISLHAVFFFISVSFLTQYMFLRWGMCLPAIALGRLNFSLGEAWELSGKENAALICIVIFTTLIITVLPIGISFLFNWTTFLQSFTYFYLVADLIFNWFCFLFSVGILTNMYGITVEGRKI